MVTEQGVASIQRFTWDAAKDCPTLSTASFTVSGGVRVQSCIYMVVDLSTGRSRYMDAGPDLSGDACRMTELWLRWIPAGTFTMGSPKDEQGRDSCEIQHEVTLTSGYWMGIFEVTQKQWSLIMGDNPSEYQGDMRPVECVSYNDIRGTEKGAGRPTGGHEADAESFLGKLRSMTGLAFDLPTEAQWEYACRAGTTTALNSGKNLTALKECPNMAEVGSYLPNAWGLYDMHGNVWEWCLDWYGGYPSSAVTDPLGAASGSYRVLRGGCRSAFRYSGAPSVFYDDRGLRVVLAP